MGSVHCRYTQDASIALDPEKRDIRLSKIAELPGLDSDLFRVGRSRRADVESVRVAVSPRGVKTGGGADRDRTDDLRLAKPALSQLSYSPTTRDGVGSRPIPGPAATLLHPDRVQTLARLRPGTRLVGLGRFELPTSRLSGGRSNQLSYRPDLPPSACGCRSEPSSLRTSLRSPKTE